MTAPETADDPLDNAEAWIDDAKAQPEDSTMVALATVGSAIALVEIARLLRPLPPEVAEANVAELALGLRGDATKLDRGVFVLPSNEEGRLDTRLLRVAVAEQIDQWYANESEGDGDLVDRMERIVRGWVAESNG